MGDGWVLLEKCSGVFASLNDPLALLAHPRPALFDHVVRNAEVEQVSFARNTLTVEQIDFCFAERSGNLVLHDFDPGPVPGGLLPVLQSRGTPHFDSN